MARRTKKAKAVKIHAYLFDNERVIVARSPEDASERYAELHGLDKNKPVKPESTYPVSFAY